MKRHRNKVAIDHHHNPPQPGNSVDCFSLSRSLHFHRFSFGFPATANNAGNVPPYPENLLAFVSGAAKKKNKADADEGKGARRRRWLKIMKYGNDLHTNLIEV